MLLNMKDLLKTAAQGGYAVGAFNIADFNFLQAIRDAAQRSKSPVIFNIADVHLRYVDLQDYLPAILSVLKEMSVPAALNFDHGMSYESVVMAVRCGFTGVMFDGARLPYEENVCQTRELAKICHAAGVSIEAELGAVGGDEGGGLEGCADSSLFTDPRQAEDFVKRTGIDALAVAIGNSHGKYKGEPRLDFPRLAEINALCRIPLVLHGGSGISAADFRRAIAHGIAKINFYTGMSQAALASLNNSLNSNAAAYNDLPEYMAQMKTAVCSAVCEQMEIFGSCGKA